MSANNYERQKKLANLKRNLVSLYGSSLLQASEPRPMEVLRKSDTPEERSMKMEINREIIAEREEEYRLHQQDMLDELNKLIQRVEDSAKMSVQQATEEFDATTAPTSGLAFGSHIICEECGNKVCFE